MRCTRTLYCDEVWLDGRTGNRDLENKVTRPAKPNYQGGRARMPLSIKNRTLMLVGTAKTLGPLHPLYYPRKKGKGVKVPLMGHQNTPNLGGLGENHKLSPKGTLVLCPMRTMDQLGPFESCIFLFIVYLLDRGKPSDPYKLRVAKPTLHIYIAYPGTTHTRAASAIRANHTVCSN